MTSGAETFTQKTKPTAKPLTFTPTTHERVRKINNVTKGAADLSSKTVGQATKYAQNIGATLARRSEKTGKEKEKPADYKPGLLNKSMIAFSTIADGIATSGKHLLTTSGAAATTVVGHRFGPEAGKVTAELTTGVKNVGLVYIDVTGVSRRALIKSTVSSTILPYKIQNANYLSRPRVWWSDASRSRTARMLISLWVAMIMRFLCLMGMKRIQEDLVHLQKVSVLHIQARVL
jgi:spartin